MRSQPGVTAVVDQGESVNGRARAALVEVAMPSNASGRQQKAAVVALRSTFATVGGAAGPDHAPHRLAGPERGRSDPERSDPAADRGALGAVHPHAALVDLPGAAGTFVALLPSAVALIASGPVIAASSHLGVQVSDLTPILLVVVLLGAGTDYGLFLIFRVREELRRGKGVDEAVSFSLCKVGESITFSGLTVVGALATVVVATFGLYQGLGPALAIGIAVALLANLTLLPALVGRAGAERLLAADPESRRPQGRYLGAHRRKGGRAAGAHPDRGTGHLRRLGGVDAGLRPDRLQRPPAPGGLRFGPGPGDPHRRLPAGRGRPHHGPLPAEPVGMDRPPGVGAGPAGAGPIQLFSSVIGALDQSGTPISPSELSAARAQFVDLGPAAELPSVMPADSSVSLAAYRAYQGSAQFISPDGRTIQFETSLRAGPSTSTAAASAIPAARAAVAAVATSIGATAKASTATPRPRPTSAPSPATTWSRSSPSS